MEEEQTKLVLIDLNLKKGLESEVMTVEVTYLKFFKRSINAYNPTIKKVEDKLKAIKQSIKQIKRIK